MGLADDQSAPMLLHSGKVPSQLPDHLAGFGSQYVLLGITVTRRARSRATPKHCAFTDADGEASRG